MSVRLLFIHMTFAGIVVVTVTPDRSCKVFEMFQYTRYVVCFPTVGGRGPDPTGVPSSVKYRASLVNPTCELMEMRIGVAEIVRAPPDSPSDPMRTVSVMVK